MILDNENKQLKVYEWIDKYTTEGKIDLVTGYFTIGALAYISKSVNNKINDFRLVLGDIVNIDSIKERALDLLNETITIDAALKLNSLAQEAVKFLKQDKVKTKTLEPNFCHAKVTLFKHDENDCQKNYYITGSSNVTEAGIGLKETNNVELNIGEFGSAPQYDNLVKWFNDLWKKPQAHNQKTIILENGSKRKMPFKEYLIKEIQKIFIEHSPKDLYYKVLFELFGEQLLLEKENPDFNRQIGRLENTAIYNTLYPFQQKGVLSLIKILQKYNGAILADAVGLGKTWSALAVMKFFQLQGREIILICPKKLHFNWLRYLKNQDSRFETDQLEYFIRFHTDLHPDRLEKYNDRGDKFFTNDKPKLFVIDESHNFRNDKSKRYRYLIDGILKKNEDYKILMLTATPINNSLQDIRNQFKLIVKDDAHGFYEGLGIRNIDYTFRTAQKAFNEWREHSKPQISDFIRTLPSNFFKLTDALTVARTRKLIAHDNNHIKFPKKQPPINFFVTPKQIGNFESFEELFEHFPPMLSGYMPSYYVEQEIDVSVLEDERQRDMFLVKMMYILMVKRLESSWHAFQRTVEKILEHHQNVLDKIIAYQKDKKNGNFSEDFENIIDEDDDFEAELEKYSIGNKRRVRLSDIEKTKNLNHYKKDLKKDIDSLDNLKRNLERFSGIVEKETKKKNNFHSADEKLEKLISLINEKRAKGLNNFNQKVVIFTVYKDTAFYLFEQLINRGFFAIGVVSGDGSKTADSDEITQNFERILERFAPFTKLFKEKEWKKFPLPEDQPLERQFESWQEWIHQNDEKTKDLLDNPVDILITTDVLSEGQNLQDCDMVINYDIHWNPVRVIQRMGRIDRIGSINDSIMGVNFWPSENINKYLDLKDRIEARMASMKIAGSEVDLKFSEEFYEMAKDEKLEEKQKARMMEQMQVTWDDIEVSEQGLGFDDLSLENYRQDLVAELKENELYYRNMPKGIYTGFKRDKEVCSKPGIIALLGYPAKPPKIKNFNYTSYDLIYIDYNGNEILLNPKEVLDALAYHKDYNRDVPVAIDQGDETEIEKLSKALKTWIKNQAQEEVADENGRIKAKMGRSAKDVLSGLKLGDKTSLDMLKSNKTVESRFNENNFDLIVWFLIN